MIFNFDDIGIVNMFVKSISEWGFNFVDKFGVRCR